MIFDRETTIKNLVNNFVEKDARERTLFELSNPKKRAKFTSRLNHNWEFVFKMQHFVQLQHAQDSLASIQQLLGGKESDLFYVISNYDEIDDKVLPLKDALTFVYSRGLGSLVINADGTKVFLETEQVQGSAKRFVGVKL